MSATNANNPKNIRALFLSFGAIIHSLKTGKVTVENLNRCLFVCSATQVNQADHIDDEAFADATAAITAAKGCGRLLWYRGNDDAPTFPQISEMLVQNQLPELLGSTGDDRTVASIPMRSAVPSVIDNVIEVIWAEVPMGKDWRKSWGVK